MVPVATYWAAVLQESALPFHELQVLLTLPPPFCGSSNHSGLSAKSMYSFSYGTCFASSVNRTLWLNGPAHAEHDCCHLSAAASQFCCCDAAFAALLHAILHLCYCIRLGCCTDLLCNAMSQRCCCVAACFRTAVLLHSNLPCSACGLADAMNAVVWHLQSPNLFSFGRPLT